MTQRNVELVLGRLLTDDELRARFLADARGMLAGVVAQGLELTSVETDALAATDAELFRLGASALDPRILKASLERTKENER